MRERFSFSIPIADKPRKEMDINKEETLNWGVSGQTGNWYNKKTHEELKGMEETEHDFEKGYRWMDLTENIQKETGKREIQVKIS